MKQVFLSILLTIYIVSFSHAQGVRFGLKAGGNLSKIESYHSTAGAVGGLTLNAPITDWLSVQSELLFSMQGYTYYSGGGGGFGFGFSKANREPLHYIQLPIIAQFRWHRLTAELGPQAGVRVSRDQYNLYRVFDVAAVAGLGYSFSDRITLTARYTKGLSNIYSPVIADDYYYARHNRVVQLLLGYQLSH